MNKMSVDRGQDAWGFPQENKMRHHDGLSRMMGISFVIHLSFFVLIMAGERWAVRQPQLQSYQVNLVSPSAGMASSSATKARGKRVRSAAAPASSKHQAIRVSRPANMPKSPVQAVRPATRSAASTTPPEFKAKAPSQASSTTVAPRTSLNVPRNLDDDPERLEEWWKKRVQSIKAPAGTSQVQAKRSLLPQKKTEKIEIGGKAPKIRIAKNLKPVFPLEQDESEKPVPTNAGKSESGPIIPVEKGIPGPFSGERLSGSSSPDQTGPAQTGVIRQSGIIGSGGVSGSAGIIGGDGIVGGGTAGSGNSGLMFPSYLQKMENKISGAWAPPPVSFQGESVNVTIQFNVMKNGHIERESIQVEKSSGNPFFDQAAMRAVYGADPFPPFPEILAEDRLSIHFNFTVLENS